MRIDFCKYQGTGNDFILLDNRSENYSSLNKDQVAFLCNRHFGIGADGLMLLQSKEGFDFEMVYFNADGAEGSMCGNGGRCLTAFAKKLGLIDLQAHFIASDGPHDAKIDHNNYVELKMKDVHSLEIYNDCTILNTGSPHYVKWVRSVDQINVFEEGRAIRTNEKFGDVGINVNFAEIVTNGLKVRTYERGVENETLSCGTGVTASAIAAYAQATEPQNILVETPGGQLTVKFQRTGEMDFESVWLCGSARMVFNGTIEF